MHSCKQHHVILRNTAAAALDIASNLAENIRVPEEDKHALTEREVTEFFETGWIVRRALFGPDEIDRMCTAFDNLLHMASPMTATGLNNGSHFVLGEKSGEQVVKRVVWAGGSQPYLLRVGEDRRLTVPAALLLGSRSIEHLLSQAHFKRPGDDVIFGWHQDIQHRDKGDGSWRDENGKGSFVQTLIVVDKMTADSGPIQFAPGSSMWGRVDFGDHDYDKTNYQPNKPSQFRVQDVVTVIADPGDVLFFGPYTAHASFENKTHNYRRVFINGYAYPGANSRIYPGEGAGRTITLS